MGIWDAEAVRVDGNLFAYIKVQNDYFGNVSGNFRRIYQDKNGHYYAKADGRNQNMDNQVNVLLEYEAMQKELKDFYNKYHIRKG